jgi:hypothetical protein
VAGQIVHHDDVAVLQLRREEALDIGLEGEPSGLIEIGAWFIL